MEIRPATANDVRRVAEIQVVSWQAAYREVLPAAYLARLDAEARVPIWRQFVGNPETPIFLATEDTEILGFCHLMPSRDEDVDNAAEIAAIYLDPATWRRGIGRLLAGTALTTARGRGYRAIILWVLEENRRARSFYEAIGFQPDGSTKRAEIGGKQVQEIRYQLSFG